MNNYISVVSSTFIVENKSFNDIFSMLHLPLPAFDDLLLSVYMTSRGVQFFCYNGIQFGVHSYYELQQHCIEAYRDLGKINRPYFSRLFSVNFDYIQVNITDKGMEWCRSAFLNHENAFFDSFLLDCQNLYESDCNFRFKKNDIAIDCINYDTDIIRAINFAYSRKVKEARESGSKLIDFVWCNRSGGSPGKGLTFKSKLGNCKRTLYIGSTNADSVLRIYDKYLENCDKHKNFKLALDSDRVFVDIDNSEIHAWVRFEIRLHNEIAQSAIAFNSLKFPREFLIWAWKRFSPGPRASDDNRHYIKLDLKEFPFWTDFFKKVVEIPFTVNDLLSSG